MLSHPAYCFKMVSSSDLDIIIIRNLLNLNQLILRVLRARPQDGMTTQPASQRKYFLKIYFFTDIFYEFPKLENN